MLSPHFALAEFIASDTARARGITNTPTPEALANLGRLAAALEHIRSYLDAPITITSGYRSTDLNRAVGGVRDSAHLTGCAADIVCPSVGRPLQVAQLISASGMQFDQLIHEFGRWVHIGIPAPGAAPRGQLLTIDGQGTRAGLLPVRG